MNTLKHKNIKEVIDNKKAIEKELRVFYKIKKEELNKNRKFTNRDAEYKKLIRMFINLEHRMEKNPNAAVTNQRILKKATKIKDKIVFMDRVHIFGYLKAMNPTKEIKEATLPNDLFL